MREYIIAHYKKYDKDKRDHVSVSLSIDATKVAPLISIHNPTQKIVGGSFPNHAIDVPDTDAEMVELIEKFKDPQKKYKFVAKVKLATVVL